MNDTAWHTSDVTSCEHTQHPLEHILASLAAGYMFGAVMVFVCAIVVQFLEQPGDSVRVVFANAVAASLALPILSITWCVLSTVCFVLGLDGPDLTVYLSDAEVRMRTRYDNAVFL